MLLLLCIFIFLLVIRTSYVVRGLRGNFVACIQLFLEFNCATIVLVEVNFEFVEGLIVERAVSHVLIRLETASLEENVLRVVLVEQHAAG